MLIKHFLLLPTGKPPIHDHEDREHHGGQEGRPLEQEPEHHEDEAHILGMTDPGVDAGGREHGFF